MRRFLTEEQQIERDDGRRARKRQYMRKRRASQPRKPYRRHVAVRAHADRWGISMELAARDILAGRA